MLRNKMVQESWELLPKRLLNPINYLMLMVGQANMVSITPYSKLGAKNRTHAVCRAIELGLAIDTTSNDVYGIAILFIFSLTD